MPLPLEKIELKPEHLRALHRHNQIVSDNLERIMSSMQGLMEQAPNDLLNNCYSDIAQKLDLFRAGAIRKRQELEAQGEAQDPEQHKKANKFARWAKGCYRQLVNMATNLMTKIKTVRDFQMPSSWENQVEIPWERGGVYSRPPGAVEQWITIHISNEALYRILRAFESGTETLRNLYHWIKELEALGGFPPQRLAAIYAYIRITFQSCSQVYLLLDRLYGETNRRAFQYHPVDPLVKYVEVEEKPRLRQLSQLTFGNHSLGRLYSYTKTAMSTAMQGMDLLFDLYQNIPDGVALEYQYDPEITRKIKIIYVIKGGNDENDNDTQDPPTPPPPTSPPRDELNNDYWVPGMPRIRRVGGPYGSNVPDWYNDVSFGGPKWWTRNYVLIEKITHFFSAISLLAAGFLRPTRT